MIDTSICELVSHPEKFSGKTVRIHAEYLDDGYQFPILIDRNCDTGGVVTSRQLLDPTVPNPLLNILQSGCAGSIGKKISGTWIGEYHWNEKNRPGTGKVPRWLDLLNIEDLVSYQEPGASNCGNP